MAPIIFIQHSVPDEVIARSARPKETTMILAFFLDGQPNRPGRAAACWSNTSLLDAAPRALGQTYMWPTAGAADVEDAS